MIPDNLLYTKSHEWAKIQGEEAVIGITQFAQEQLGDLTFVELPEAGQTISAGEEMGTVESVKAASEIYAPISGEVVEVNSELEDAPEKVNEDPYGQGWLIKIKIAEVPENLLSPSQYEAHIAEEAH
ncbi:glycine cleavage system protein GcvH [Desulfoplanes formicivorans]|uniref:Glycine cleavage system H protein n=1 Tax=Desulfoplanes formicivorans TaxID=1592317 RepID=A0A194AJ46_9BACT|nr:glycine cleavage system protein GcvH [Desulfoplanes formicivorans]GAU09086.1 glycine cleavage system protein H [Desulfoplanes formicivorans]